MKDYKGIIKQAYPDIQKEKDHEAKALKAVRFLGMNNTELNKCYQLNKDLDSYDIKMKDFTTMDI